MGLTSEQEEIKADFIRVRGAWGETWERMLELDPAFVRAYLDFSAVPWRKGVLSPKIKEFVYIAADAAATHMFGPGVRQHVRAALGLGATPAEIMEVIELTSTLGIHACNVGVPVLLEVLAESGRERPPEEFTGRQEELKADFVANRGYWDETWDGLLRLDPDLFDAYSEFSAVPWRTGTIEPKYKELVYVAFDAAATHLYVPGLKIHMRNALRLGASTAEVMEVLEIVSVIGIHAALLAAPILAEEAQSAASA